MYKNIIFIFLMTLGAMLWAQEKTENLQVKGNCGMCKERIESAVRELPSANGSWDLNSQILTVQFDESKTNLDEIAKNIAKVGHDNELYSAEKSVYENLPGCCLYTRDLQESVTENQIMTETIKVRGNCGSCKKRIENAVKTFPSASGNWDVLTKVLTLTYDPNQTSKEAIMRKIAEVGHDNELFTAEDSVYENLPGCCLYDREMDWDNIENSEGTHVEETEAKSGHDDHVGH